ncbi:MAG: 2-oxo acid dehydrogenase subunit E2 [Bacteroidota bacterium]|nr:2-oxo acid dehydrogenase subunit E2 [Bacteroidota bacterium]
MALVEMVMPKMGESIMEGTILNWLKKEGDKIEQDESVLEVATDKVDTEVPAIHGGILKQILAKEGEVVAVGKPIAILSTDDEGENNTEDDNQNNKEFQSSKAEETAVPDQVTASEVEITGESKLEQPVKGRFYSPLVMNIARQEKISMEELEYIAGTGKEDRVSKKDILNYLQVKKGKYNTSTEISTATTPYWQDKNIQPDFVKEVSSADNDLKSFPSLHAEEEIIQMDRMRKMIAERMVASKRISPHVTSFVEADVTTIVMWRNKYKNEFKNKTGDSLTYTPIFIEAVVKAIKDYPMVNVSVDGDRIIKKNNINIGMAVALPTGNLIVPVIKNADQYNIAGLTAKVNDLARRARIGKITPDELSGGTYSISNVGSFGNIMGTPIIMQPQVAILALGAIVKKPAVIETPAGDAIAIRHKMFLSHSYDHRVVDGALGGMFVRRVADYLERFEINRGI